MPVAKLTVASVLVLFAACHSDPGPCRPGDATFSMLSGSVTVQGGMSETFDAGDPSATPTCTVSSRPSGDRDADVAMRTTVNLLCESQGERLGLSFEIDDVRPLGAGEHTLVTDDYGLRISYRPSESAPECYTYLADTAYALTVNEAVGTEASYPTLVTGDFHRRFDVALDLALAGRHAMQYTNGVVSDCSLDFVGAVDFTAVLDHSDVQARAVDSCVLE